MSNWRCCTGKSSLIASWGILLNVNLHLLGAEGREVLDICACGELIGHWDHQETDSDCLPACREQAEPCRMQWSDASEKVVCARGESGLKYISHLIPQVFIQHSSPWHLSTHAASGLVNPGGGAPVRLGLTLLPACLRRCSPEPLENVMHNVSGRLPFNLSFWVRSFVRRGKLRCVFAPRLSLCLVIGLCKRSQRMGPAWITAYMSTLRVPNSEPNISIWGLGTYELEAVAHYWVCTFLSHCWHHGWSRGHSLDSISVKKDIFFNSRRKGFI